VGEWWREIERRFARARLFYGHGTHDAREESAWLVCHVLRIPFGEMSDALDRTVSGADARRLRTLAERRIRTREPLAYVLREAWLQHRRFHVDRRVIVPRSHIAELLPESLSAWLPRAGPRRILDLCTGSGCLAILAALAFPRARVDASDVSAGALALALRNITAYGLGARVRPVRSDLFDGLRDVRYDLIICNPPYVAEAEMQRLPAEYRYEPRIALASGRDGLDFVRRLIADGPRHLAPRGLLVVEIGDGRAALERALPRLAVTWLPTEAGEDLVFAVTRDELAIGANGVSPAKERAN
jgi:ribosomal protein L3 glutamine methyltransferase